jgi:FMN phosphatase YigB (HAD superfamily)
VDDVQGARATGLRVAWLNRSGWPRRADLPAADFEIRALTVLIGIIL